MIDSHLNGIEKPGRYIGLELNACQKSFESASVRFALAFPDVYEIGLSHIGLQLLYHQLNGAEGVMADRVYAPWPDYEAKLRGAGEPLRAIESGRALAEFDFLGVSLQYELSYSNILTILDLAPVPLYARDRTKLHPFVIGGGPCAFNPEPLEIFLIFSFWVRPKRFCPKSLLFTGIGRRAGRGAGRIFYRRSGRLREFMSPPFSKSATVRAASYPPSSPGFQTIPK